MVKYNQAIEFARSLIGTPYSELDCINLIKKIIRDCPGGKPGYTTSGTDELWASYTKSAKYRDLTYRQEGLDGVTGGWLVFKGKATDAKDGEPHHVGLATGIGTVIHSSSVNGRGVVETPLTAKEGWTLAAKHRYISTQEESAMPDGETLYRAEVTTQQGGLYLRSEPQKDRHNVILVVPRGAVVDVKIEEVAAGWDFVQYGDKSGYCASEFLTPVSDGAEPEPEITTTLQSADGVMITLMGDWTIIRGGVD